MNPQQLDPQVVNLAKSIRQIESGGNFSAQGKSGEYGAYQYTPQTWSVDSAKYGVNVPLEQANPVQQNEVAYKKLSDLKSQGYNVGQIASIWNSGKPDWTGNVGVNSKGVAYDTPQYVDSVAKTYQAYKSGANPTSLPVTSSTVGAFNPKPFSSAGSNFSFNTTGQQPDTTPTPKGDQGLGEELSGRLSDAGTALTNASNGKINWLSGVIQALGAGAGAVGDVVNKGLELVPGVKKVEGLIGTGAGKLAQTSIGKSVLDQVDRFKQAHPELADDIGAGFNIATAIPIFRGLGTVADVALSGAGKALAGIAEKGALSDLTDALSRTKTLSRSFAQNGGQSTLKEGIAQRVIPDIADGKYATQEASKTLGTMITDIEDNELQPALAKANTGAIATQQSLDSMANDAGNFARTQFKPTGSVIDKVKNMLADYKASYGDYPTLQDITDIKRDIRSGVNFNSPKLDQSAAYILGQYLQKNVEEAATKLGLGDVGAINAKMGNLIKYQNMLQSLDGSPVKLGRVGRVLKAVGGDVGMVAGETAGNAIGLPFAGTLGGRALGGSLSKAGGGLIRTTRNAILKRTGENAIVPSLGKIGARSAGLVGASLLQKSVK